MITLDQNTYDILVEFLGFVFNRGRIYDNDDNCLCCQRHVSEEHTDDCLVRETEDVYEGLSDR